MDNLDEDRRQTEGSSPPNTEAPCAHIVGT